MKLTLAIPTVSGREEQFDKLYEFCQKQAEGLQVEVIYLKDNKEMSIGAKRQRLYEMSKGEWTVMIDDDDWISDDYVVQVLAALDHNPDCVGYIEDCDIDGRKEKSSISKEWTKWYTYGRNHYRTPYFKVPIRTSLCLQAGVADIRFGENHEFSRRIHPMIKTEVYLDIPMYYYRRVTKRGETHAQRYGI